MNKKPTILLVDDTKENINILLSLLGDYDLLVALSGKKALEMVEKYSVDIILLDIMMPEMDGFEVCSILKQQDSTKDIPIIFITAKTDEDSIEKAYDIGGSDYITKPFRHKELIARVRRELKLQNLQAELRLLASIDPMTKLYNRRYFTKISEHTFDLARRDNKEISTIMIDIDKFKAINDTYGHQVGDEVIIKLADILIEHQRKSDITCRYGGEEFVLLLPNTSITGATTLAQKIKQTIDDTTMVIDTQKQIKFSVSMGVSEVDLKNESDINKALKRADDALYEAKNSGRNRICTK